MADNAKTDRALVAQAAADKGEKDFDTALAGVEGKVRKAIVTKLRALVDRDPAQFVKGMRTWMHQGHSDE